jgi:hypothetical protein
MYLQHTSHNVNTKELPDKLCNPVEAKNIFTQNRHLTAPQTFDKPSLDTPT